MKPLQGGSLWQQPHDWPPGNRDRVFLLKAVQLVGKARFGSGWTGREGLPPVAVARTLRIREEVRIDFPPDGRAEGATARTPMALARIGQLRADEKAEERENELSSERLAEVVEWIRDRCSSEVIPSFTMAVGGGPYVPASVAIWNAHPIFEKLFQPDNIEASGGFSYFSPGPLRQFVFLDHGGLMLAMRSDGLVVRSGAPGRRTSKHLVIPEVGRRIREGLAYTKLKDEAQFLCRWLQSEHPEMPPLKQASMQNVVREARVLHATEPCH